MNKESEIIQIMTAVGSIGEFSVTLGFSEELELPCIFVLKDSELFNSLQSHIQILQEAKGNFEVFIPEQKIIGLLTRLGQLMNATISIAVDGNLGDDSVFLFNDVELVNSIYKEWETRETTKWNRI